MPRRSLAHVLLAAALAVALAVALGGRSAGRPAAGAGRPAEQAVLGAVGEPSVTAPRPLPLPAATALPTASPVPASPAVGTSGPPLPAPSSRRGSPGRPLRVVTLGDSLTAWPSGNPWPRRLDALDPFVTLVHNAGVPGNTTAQMRTRLGRDVLAYRPDVLFVLGGTNDVGRGIARSTTIANLRAIVEAARPRGIRVFLLTIPPDSFPSLAPRVRALNAAIRSLAAAEQVPLVDIYAPLASPAGLYLPGYTVDGLHFSSPGTALVAATVRLRLAGLGL